MSNLTLKFRAAVLAISVGVLAYDIVHFEEIKVQFAATAEADTADQNHNPERTLQIK